MTAIDALFAISLSIIAVVSIFVAQDDWKDKHWLSFGATGSAALILGIAALFFWALALGVRM